MALSNKDRQRKWVEKNRALHNFRRRKAREKLSGAVTGGIAGVVEQRGRLLSQEAQAEMSASENIRNDVTTAQPFTTKKVGEFRMLVLPEKQPHEEPTLPVVKPQVFRDDYGRVITEAQWNRLQGRKEKAREGNYVLDEYSQ